jgi:GT2 family glycosyltransferase
MSVCAYVPCFNNASSLEAAIRSLLAQGLSLADVFVIDDGSTDGSVSVARSMNIKVKLNGGNRGRGFTRARAMREAKQELVLACDATKVLAPDFLALALKWMDSPRVAAVFGRVVRQRRGNCVERWESRHIFKEGSPGEVNRRASLATGGVLARRSAVLQTGNFNEELRHSEDAELGARLLAAGFEVVCDPALHLIHSSRTRFLELMERYWRWHAGAGERTDWRGYPRIVSYSIKSLAREDWRAGDWAGIPISLFVPHYQFWKTFWRNLRRTNK